MKEVIIDIWDSPKNDDIDIRALSTEFHAKSHLNIHGRNHRCFHFFYHFCLENVILIATKYAIKFSISLIHHH